MVAQSQQVTRIWQNLPTTFLTLIQNLKFFTANLVGSTIISKLGRFNKEVPNQLSCLNVKLDHTIGSPGSILIRI